MDARLIVLYNLAARGLENYDLDSCRRRHHVVSKGRDTADH